MPEFSFEALNDQGESVAGQLEADSVNAAIDQLASRGMTVRSIKLLDHLSHHDPVLDAQENRLLSSGNVERDNIRRAQIPLYLQRIEQALQQQSRLLPVMEAFAAEHASRNVRRELQKFIARIRAGITPQQFVEEPELVGWLPIMLSGANSASMADRYRELIGRVSQEDATRRHRRFTLVYPTVLLVLTTCLLLGICLWVLPIFHNLFQGLGLRVPTLTRWVLGLSNAVNQQPLTFVVGLVALLVIGIVLVRFWIQTALTTRLFGALVSGNSHSLMAMSRFTSVLAELVAIDAPLSDALRIAGDSCKHEFFRRAAKQLASESQRNDGRLSSSPIAHNFPACVLHGLQSGVNGGPNQFLLRELSTMYRERVRRRTSNLAGVGSPMLLMAVGAMIALVVLAVFLPLVTLVTSLT